jgi:trehalose-phosphatase
VKDRIRKAKQMRLFLDYDGTLASFAPTPDDILPDPYLIGLMEQLSSRSHIQVAVISGRRLSHIQALLPIEGILLGGTYGIEILTAQGIHIERLDFQIVRPTLDLIKPLWENLIKEEPGFYLEDKGWSLALHARGAKSETANQIITLARSCIQPALAQTEVFRILGGHKFLEVAPLLANKGQTINHLLSIDPLDSALPIYIGDDDKDEEAFRMILQNDGVAIKVSPHPCETAAQLRLESPENVRRWLSGFL